MVAKAHLFQWFLEQGTCITGCSSDYISEQPILISVSVRISASGLVSVSVGTTDTDTTFTS